jgi:uncharacterized protein DUF6084
MREIVCRLESVAELKYAVVPTIALGLRVSSNQPVSGVDLRCQIAIDVPTRVHSAAERARLTELFGATSAGAALRPLLWAHTSANVPAFDRQCTVDLTVALSFDFDLAVAKYFHGLEGEGIPLRLQFSGMIFYRDGRDQLQIARIPWTTEATGQLPLALVRALRDRYYPGSAWLRMPRGPFERLTQYRRAAGLPSWESALDRLLDAADEASTVTERAR